MKILEITTFLRGGAGAFLTRLSCEFKRRGHNVEVISSGNVEEIIDWDELLDELIKYEINHHKLNFFKRDNEIFWTEVEKLAQLIKENNYDVIHVHAGVPALACYMAKKMAGKDVPIIATFHSWGKDRPDWMNICDAWAFNRCNKVFFDSNEYMRFGKSKGITTQAEVIYPGLMMDENISEALRHKAREELTKKLNIPSDSVIITNLAEITQRKGQVDLVKALGSICYKREDVYLCLIGESRDKRYYDELMDTIERLGLKGKVFLLGWVEEPHKFIAASDIFVFPTYSEGLGLAIVEAIVLGVPTIFSSVEGTKDIENILGSTCLGTFEPGDFNRISKLVLEILEKDQLIISSRINDGIKKVMDNFDFNNTVNRYEEEMKQVIKNKG